MSSTLRCPRTTPGPQRPRRTDWLHRLGVVALRRTLAPGRRGQRWWVGFRLGSNNTVKRRLTLITRRGSLARYDWYISVSASRPDLPLPLKREVRQRCGFGCVLCGFPIYEYDHILGWANVRRHNAAEITLLCKDHHGAKTAGFLPNERVIEANKHPWNLRAGVTKPYELFYSGDEFHIEMGVKVSGTARGPHTAITVIQVDDEPLLWLVLEDNHYLLNLKVYDSQRRLALYIADNELVLNTQSWDIEIVGTRLTIREAARDILFDVFFKPPSTVIVKRGWFICNGIELLVSRDWFALLNTSSLYRDIAVENANVALYFGDRPPPYTAIHHDGKPRYGWDRDMAIKNVRSMVAESERTYKILQELLRLKAFG
jgi:hypothetical protein